MVGHRNLILDISILSSLTTMIDHGGGNKNCSLSSGALDDSPQLHVCS